MYETNGSHLTAEIIDCNNPVLFIITDMAYGSPTPFYLQCCYAMHEQIGMISVCFIEMNA